MTEKEDDASRQRRKDEILRFLEWLRKDLVSLCAPGYAGDLFEVFLTEARLDVYLDGKPLDHWNDRLHLT